MAQHSNASFTNNVSATPIISGSNAYISIFQQYEKVIINSLITSFGLDFLLTDQHGGDVDTIHNVRKIGQDELMSYKNSANESAYQNKPNYDPAAYHANSNFQQIKHQAREDWQTTGKDFADQYQSGKVGFYGHTNSISPDKKAELDHIIECKTIHDDRGRILSGLSGEQLANDPSNFAWTNKSLNASMGSWAKGVNQQYRKEHGCDAPLELCDKKAYVEAHPELDKQTKENILNHYSEAKKNYDAQINRAYYTSKTFFRDTTSAALKTGVRLGVRQAVGLFFSEIWFAVKDAIKAGKESGVSLFNSIGNGIKQGIKNAKERYKELTEKLLTGSLSGALSSLATTLCNIFFSTAKSLVRIIRQAFPSLISAIKTLLYNPQNLPFGEKMRAAAKILATGASIVVGTMVSEAIAKTGISAIPVVGPIIETFCGSLVAGIMSCSLLYLLDNNKVINKIVALLNKIPTVANIVAYYQRQAALLDEYCAQLLCIDLDTFKREVATVTQAVESLCRPMSPDMLHNTLISVHRQLNIPLPWQSPQYKSEDDFWTDRNTPWGFK